MKPQMPDNVLPAPASLPLYELYQAVKERDLQTGHATVDIQSYFLLLETLMRGYMITSEAELLALCERLWLKPYHRQGNSLNKEILATLLRETLAVHTSGSSLGQPVSPTTPNSTNSVNSGLPFNPPSLPNAAPTPPTKEDVALTQQEGTLNLYLANKAVGRGASIGADEHASKFLKKSFLTKGRYLPVNGRRLAQSIRSYRFAAKGGQKTAVDLEATISRIAKTNFFEDFEYKSDESFTTDWTLLIDCSPSMAAFYPLCDEIVRIVTEDATNRGQVFYFKNYPTTHLFYDRPQTRSVLWTHFAARKKGNILIVGDAGAARGAYNEKTIMAVVKMLQQLKQHNIAWLNPMPQARWRDTSAEMIAEFVDMFEPGEGNNDGIATIVRLFKSKIRAVKNQ
jgi:hypothetical protein